MATDETARVSRLHGIYAIVNETGNVLDLARATLDAGIGIIQYRAKRGIIPAHLRALREITSHAGALLVVNDDWRAVIEFDCDGVHLGPDDDGFVDVAPVREAIGTRLIGLSCGTVEEAREANRLGADYIGVGSVYATASKADAGDPIGIEGLRRVAAVATMPVVAIGGITAHNLEPVRQSGVAMAAVISAIAGASDPRAAARDLVRRWNGDGEV
ncbi:MAG: thiamine phosphate synthase [Candidatus Eremiobacteraeota bacterium]|nr:thiamine phosphate synthase [Candidatus Eremiobacteraeota bacterium]